MQIHFIYLFLFVLIVAGISKIFGPVPGLIAAVLGGFFILTSANKSWRASPKENLSAKKNDSVFTPVDVYETFEAAAAPVTLTHALPLAAPQIKSYKQEHSFQQNIIDKYSTAYPDLPDFSDPCHQGAKKDIDSSNLAQTTARLSRDKKMYEGFNEKNMNFYKVNYANELADYEKKQWWGNNEY